MLVMCPRYMILTIPVSIQTLFYFKSSKIFKIINIFSKYVLRFFGNHIAYHDSARRER